MTDKIRNIVREIIDRELEGEMEPGLPRSSLAAIIAEAISPYLKSEFGKEDDRRTEDDLRSEHETFFQERE